MSDKQTRKEQALKIQSWCVSKFNWLIEENIKEYLTFEELITEFRRKVEFKVDDQMMRSGIHRAIADMRNAGFVIMNKRNVGYKVADKFEAMDNKEKQFIRIAGRVAELTRDYLNHTLSIEDIMGDENRQTQHMILMALIENSRSFIKSSEDLLRKSPFFKENKKNTKVGSDLDIVLREDDEARREQEFEESRMDDDQPF
jgi:hypothetical protein